jgi:broad specificity polyphosphatase/5'/3'-nucleotidase SurE
MGRFSDYSSACHYTRNPLLPAGVALNVNFPNAPAANSAFAFSHIGTYDLYSFKFKNSVPYGLAIGTPGTPTAEQAEDESVVSKTKVSVSVMQVGFEHRPAAQQWLRLRLRDLLAQ